MSKSFLDSTRRIVEVVVGGLVARRLGASVSEDEEIIDTGTPSEARQN